MIRRLLTQVVHWGDAPLETRGKLSKRLFSRKSFPDCVGGGGGGGILLRRPMIIKAAHLDIYFIFFKLFGSSLSAELPLNGLIFDTCSCRKSLRKMNKNDVFRADES